MADSVKVQFGVVKWFDPWKGYGFLTVWNPKSQRMQDVFFHQNDVYFIDRDKDGGPCFLCPIQLGDKEVPQPDAEIVFVEALKFRGPQAVKWGSAERWHRLMAEIAVPAKVAAAKIAEGWGVEAAA